MGWVVARAVKSIYVFAPGAEHTITREQAAAILKWWQHHSELSEREVDAILRRFPPLDTSWISGSMGNDQTEPEERTS